ncbi:MAG: DUF655 domain-containing protein [Candidatus Bathyarchaeota archaeon]|nr:DUF655 domain-containing protein [Candidatus Bathyarchaeota archaeon]
MLYREAKKYEEYAYVLDFLFHGRSGQSGTPHTQSGLLQLIGDSYCTLLEASPIKDENYTVREKIFVGKGERARVSHIIGRIRYADLSGSAKAELPGILELVVAENEPYFVTFFNISQQVTPSMHSLDLIPGVGKKLMFHIVNIREKTPFKSFKDIEERANLKDPAKQVAKRIFDELSQTEKYLLFTRPYVDRLPSY